MEKLVAAQDKRIGALERELQTVKDALMDEQRQHAATRELLRIAMRHIRDMLSWLGSARLGSARLGSARHGLAPTAPQTRPRCPKSSPTNYEPAMKPAAAGPRHGMAGSGTEPKIC